MPVGVTEIACHPGYDDGLETMYASSARWKSQPCATNACGGR